MSERKYTLAELTNGLRVLIERQEMLKQTQQVMASKLGLDWEACCDKARRRIEIAQRVQAEMEARVHQVGCPRDSRCMCKQPEAPVDG